MNVAVGAKTDVGQVREANEDSYLVDEPLFVVADGMGGHIAGDVASSTAVSVISGKATTASADDLETLAELVRSANKAIWEKAGDDPSLRGMGTTCTLMLVDDSKAHFAHVGDSRAYLLRGGQLSQITEDHTLVGRMVKEGKLRPDEVENHPQRSIITRALGVDSDVEVDLLSLDLQPGDRILINSDGLSSMIPDEAIAGPLRDESDPQAAAEHLVELANRAGGEDNVTVVVVDITDRNQRAAATAVHRSPTVSAERPAPPAQAVAKRTWPRKLAIGILVLAALAVGGYFAGQAYLDNQWYVGLNDDDVVTVFNGIDGDVFGMSLSSVSEVSDPPIALADLPESERESVQEGLTVDSEEEAQDKVQSLRAQAEEQRDLAEPKPKASPSPGEGGDKAADKRREEKSGDANN
jgi:PPM family protein phosphatase